MGKWLGWCSRARLLVWSTIGFLVLLGGVVSNRADMIVLGTVWLFVVASAYLAFYVKSEHRVKRVLEVVFVLLALCVIVYGYVVVGSFILGVITLLIVIMGFIAFLLSYLLPKIRRQSGGHSRDIWTRIARAKSFEEKRPIEILIQKGTKHLRTRDFPIFT